MRRFYLHRDDDPGGVSGSGFVAEGIHMSNGKVIISWRTKYTSTAQYDDLETMLNVHGHGGKTRLIWVDDTPSQPKAPPPEEEDEVLICAFCGKSNREVSKLIAGPFRYGQAHICNECVDLCSEIVSEDEVELEEAQPHHGDN